jgi:hypothetical protein
VGKPHDFCEYGILPNHLHEIYEVCVLTGNFPLPTFNIQQDEKTVRQPMNVGGLSQGSDECRQIIAQP